jgi:hypothetical protein
MIPKGHLLRRINIFVTSVLGDLRSWVRSTATLVGLRSIPSC